MATTQLATEEKTIGQINEMFIRAQDRISTARNIAQRIQDLRVRLIGGDQEGEISTDAPEPVRSEIDNLSHNLNVLGVVLNEIESDLSVLEGL